MEAITNRWHYSLLISMFLLWFPLLADGQSKEAPLWVKDLPQGSGTYYGIGLSKMKDQPDYRSVAQQMALRDLAEKIYVSINSASALTLKYEQDKARYLLDETIELEASNLLGGHEKVDHWTDRKNKVYYVLYSLDKFTYQENRRAYFQALDDVLRHMSLEAQELINDGQLVRGINQLSEIIDRLDREMDGLIEPEYEVNLQKFRLSTIFELERQINRLELQTSPQYTFTAANQPLLIRNFAVDRVTGEPFSDVKLGLKVMRGDVFNYAFEKAPHRNDLVVYGLYPENQRAMIQLVAEIPMDERILASLDDAVPNKLVSNPILIRFEPYDVHIEADELDARGNPAKPRLTGFIRSITEDLGLVETAAGQSHYQLEVISRENVTRERRDLYEAYYKARLVVRQTSDNREVFTYEFPVNRAWASKAGAALNDSFRHMVKYNEEFVSSFVTFLCTSIAH